MNEKKELTHKVISKDCKDKHQLQMAGKIEASDLIKLFTTFKPCDYPFDQPEIDDEPITMKSSVFLKYPKKLPTYRFQIVDYNAFYLSLKILISVLKFQSTSDKSIEFIADFCKYFFKIECANIDDLSCLEYSDSDRDVLISIIAPHILNKHHSDEEEQDSSNSQVAHSPNSSEKEKDHNPQESFKDCLSFADIENHSFLELIDTNCFSTESSPNQDEKDESYMNTDTLDKRTLEELIENEEFVPFFKQEYSVLFGSSSYFVFIRCLFTMYERLRLAHKIICDQVNHDYNEKKEEVLNSYQIYLRAKERQAENDQSNNKAPGNVNAMNINKEINLNDLDENEIKRAVINHKLAILIGISVTRYKSKIDSSTFEDLVRTFLGIKSFFFFTFDKLIHTTIKSFHALLNDEFLKSKSFRIFQKYCKLNDRQREKLYLEDYRSRLNEMNLSGCFTARMLFSPKSKILCINFFNVAMPYTNSALVEELNEYRSNFTLKPSNEKMYSGDLPIPSSSVFLKRNKKLIMKSFENKVAIINSLSNSFSTSCLKARYRAGKTDVVQRLRRKTTIENRENSTGGEIKDPNIEIEATLTENHKRVKEAE